MASKKLSSTVSQLAIQEIRREIFGHAPILNIRSGFQELKKPHTGPYLARYYFDNHIDSAARKVCYFMKKIEEICTRTYSSHSYITLGDTGMDNRIARSTSCQAVPVEAERQRTTQERSWKAENQEEEYKYSMN